MVPASAPRCLFCDSPPRGDSIKARALAGQRDYAEAQMFHTGKGARREFESLEAALSAYHAHLTSGNVRRAFVSGWELGE